MLLPETLRVHDREQFDFAYGYFLDYKGQLANTLIEQDVMVQCFNANGAAKMLLSVPKVARFAQDWGAELIHCHLPLAGVVGRLAGKLSNIPVIYTEHNKQERYHPLTRKANLWTMPINQLVLSVSGEVEKSLRHNLNGTAPPIRTLLNGVNTTRFDRKQYDKKMIRQELGLSPETPIIGTVCVFRVQKRLHYWLDLAKKVLSNYPNTHFILVGDGPEEENIRAKVKQLNLNDRVHFPGRLEEVRPWLAAMDIYLMTSEFEGLPIAMLEAMSMELPVVATTAGGIGEVVREGKEGFLSTINACFALEKGLLQLLSSPSLRETIGRNARQRVIEGFSIERMMRELEEIYREVLL